MNPPTSPCPTLFPGTAYLQICTTDWEIFVCQLFVRLIFISSVHWQKLEMFFKLNHLWSIDDHHKAEICWFEKFLLQNVHTIWWVSQLSAHYTSISVVPEIITNGAPSAIDTHLHSTVPVPTRLKSQRPILAKSCGTEWTLAVICYLGLILVSIVQAVYWVFRAHVSMYQHYNMYYWYGWTGCVKILLNCSSCILSVPCCVYVYVLYTCVRSCLTVTCITNVCTLSPVTSDDANYNNAASLLSANSY